MNQETHDLLERRLDEQPDRFPFPPTPDFVARAPWRQQRQTRLPAPRRLLLAAVLILALLCGLLAVPQVRAAIFEILHIGTISIIPATMTPQPIRTGTPAPTPLVSVLDLVGETTLQRAEGELGVPIRLPAYPGSPGQPDKIFMQGFGAPVVILVWVDKAQPEQAQMSLYILGPNVYADKFSPQIIQQTTVNGKPAIWTQGDHALLVKNRQGTDVIFTMLVRGNILIWTDGTLTYRLETALPLAEAVNVAESLH